MAAQPSSVPTCRRFVEETLGSWGREDLVDDLVLCVSELSTNATLHSGSGYFEVELAVLGDAVRLIVVDGGGTSAQTIAARADSCLDELVLGDGVPGREGMTGRGLFIVGALARSWGIEDTDGGTMVWADFVAAGAHTEPARPVGPRVHAARPTTRLSPGELRTVLFPQCPPGLLLAHDENLADLVRELQLMGPAEGTEAAWVLQEVSGVVRRAAVAWDAARLQAREAVQQGSASVDIAILTSPAAAEEVRRLRRAVDVAETLAAGGQLITLPAPVPVQQVRRWLEDQVIGQAAHGDSATSFPAWLAAQ